MRIWTVCLLALIVGSISAPSGRASAASSPNRTVLRGGGWTLTLSTYPGPYGQAVRGSITHLGHAYAVQGDAIPSVDAPRYLLRFYGPAFPGTASKTTGLISAAILESSCPPKCPHGCVAVPCPAYQPGWELLHALSGWSLPGAPSVRQIRLKTS